MITVSKQANQIRFDPENKLQIYLVNSLYDVPTYSFDISCNTLLTCFCDKVVYPMFIDCLYNK
jgi:hypothetical protein